MFTFSIVVMQPGTRTLQWLCIRSAANCAAEDITALLCGNVDFTVDHHI